MMIVYTDNSVIQKQGPNNVFVKLAKAISSSGTSHGEELEVIKLPTEYVSRNLNQINKLCICRVIISNKNYNGMKQKSNHDNTI